MVGLERSHFLKFYLALTEYLFPCLPDLILQITAVVGINLIISGSRHVLLMSGWISVFGNH
jgi:hypothetical protein